MAAIFQTAFSNAFSWKKMYKFRLILHRSGPADNIPALFQVMAWCQPGDKPLSEPMMGCSPTQICVTRPQWVKTMISKLIQNRSLGTHWNPEQLAAQIYLAFNTMVADDLVMQEAQGIKQTKYCPSLLKMFPISIFFIDWNIWILTGFLLHIYHSRVPLKFPPYWVRWWLGTK